MRSLVAYDDLPHTPQGLAQASHAKRRRCDAPYVGPHWDDTEPDLDEADEHKGLQLSQFEMAQLANLSVTDIDEARTLIPTYVCINSL